MIPLTRPIIEQDDIDAVVETLRSAHLVQGPRVAEFEAVCARYVGVAHGVAVSSCTAALHLALLALGVGSGDRVAVPTYSWPATANVVLLTGAEPVFVDIDDATFAMSVDGLRSVFERGDIRAVIPVHPFGGAADMQRISHLAHDSGCVVVEDAACAFGGSIDGSALGSWGRIGCFSFHPRKAVTTGEGGVVVTDDEEAAAAVRRLRNHGVDGTAQPPEFVDVGFNYRMTEFQAALGASQVRKAERLIDQRREAARTYDELLAETAVSAPRSLAGSRHVYQSYVAMLPRGADRPRVIETLRDNGVETTIGTYHIPLTRYYRERFGYSLGDFPATDEAAPRAITLPLFPGITLDQQRTVVRLLSSTVGG